MVRIVFAFFWAISLTEASVIDVNPYLTSDVLALPGEFPSAVFISSPSAISQFCTGTIVDRNHILTSAQCVISELIQNVNPFWLKIIAGDLNIVSPSTYSITRTVTRIFVHPGFHFTLRDNDLALLRINEPFPEFHNTIETASRNNDVMKEGTVCKMAAWGTSVFNILNAPIQPELRVINVPLLNNDDCNSPNIHMNRVLNHHICAGSLTRSSTGACLYNIGAGLYCNEQLTGVLSFGLSCGSSVIAPGVYTDIRLYKEWIDLQLDQP